MRHGRKCKNEEKGTKKSFIDSALDHESWFAFFSMHISYPSIDVCRWMCKLDNQCGWKKLTLDYLRFMEEPRKIYLEPKVSGDWQGQVKVYP